MTESRRPHTGRRRNEAARQAILDAALELLDAADGTPVTVETIAARAGVGKQTIYRWWPSKTAVILDVLREFGRVGVGVPDTGTLDGDLEAFLAASYANGGRAVTRNLLRTVVAEALRDPVNAAALDEFAAGRRTVLRGILERARERGDFGDGVDLDLVVDQAFGVLWYRTLLPHGVMTAEAGRELAHALTAQVRAT